MFPKGFLTRKFADRGEAGRILAQELLEFRGRPDVIVLALPRGGVPVAFEVATALEAPLEVFTVRKIGAPWNPELAIGAIASGGRRIFDPIALRQLQLPPDEIERMVAGETEELERRERLYRESRPFPALAGRIVILIDDGLATGATMRVAVEAVRAEYPAQVIVAAPVASREACEMLAEVADRVVCVDTPEPLYGVGMWYEDFSQTSDEEVLDLLRRAAARFSHAA
jgi:predicted phosphoribosyltransferase